MTGSLLVSLAGAVADMPWIAHIAVVTVTYVGV